MRLEESLSEARQQLEAEAAARRLADGAVAAKQGELDSALTAAKAAVEAHSQRESWSEGERRAAETRALAAEARLAEMNERLEARSVDKMAQQVRVAHA